MKKTFNLIILGIVSWAISENSLADLDTDIKAMEKTNKAMEKKIEQSFVDPFEYLKSEAAQRDFDEAVKDGKRDFQRSYVLYPDTHPEFNLLFISERVNGEVDNFTVNGQLVWVEGDIRDKFDVAIVSCPQQTLTAYFIDPITMQPTDVLEESHTEVHSKAGSKICSEAKRTVFDKKEDLQ